MTFDYPDGTQLVQDFPLMVEGESSDGGSTFQWLLEPDQVVAGMRFRAKLIERERLDEFVDREQCQGLVVLVPRELALGAPAAQGGHVRAQDLDLLLERREGALAFGEVPGEFGGRGALRLGDGVALLVPLLDARELALQGRDPRVPIGADGGQLVA